jgi:uncharacterized protein YcfL
MAPDQLSYLLWESSLSHALKLGGKDIILIVFFFKPLEEVMKFYPLSYPFSIGIRIVLLLAMLLLNFGPGGTGVAYAAPPQHDDINFAKQIDAIEYHDLNVNTTEATPSDTVPNAGDPDNFLCEGVNFRYGFASVWYQYTPPQTQSLSLDTLGSTDPLGADYDTFIAVWTGAPGALNLVACNDDTFEGLVSELSFVASTGITYYIEVAQHNDGQGTTDIIGGNLNFNAYITNTNVYVGGNLQARYFIPSGGSLRRSFINLNDGPVQLINLAGNQIMAAERVIYTVNSVPTSYSEIMGVPNGQLDNVYWLPWFNDLTLDSQLRIGNVSASTASVNVFIAGAPMPGNPHTLTPGASARLDFPGVNSGPVKIESNTNIVAAARVLYTVKGVPTSFSEMMALPEKQLDTTFWLPWYNNTGLDTQLRIANVSGLAASVQVTIGGVPQGAAFPIPAGGSVRKSYPGVNNGPVKIVSNRPIVAAERVLYTVNGVPTSFTEMMALPNTQLDTTYWLPWYNNTGLDTQLRFANVSTQPGSVKVFIAGALKGTFPLGPGLSTRQSFAGINNGPVRIESTVDIVVAQRVIYKVNGIQTSFTEMMGLQNGLLGASYWMPWYNNLHLDTQLRFGMP